MSFFVPHRRPVSEALDDQNLASEEMCRSLRDLELVNRLFGSSGALARAIARGSRAAGVARPRILDVGAGAGDVSRRISIRLRREGLDPEMTALDLQWRHLAFGRRRSGGRPRRAVTGDVFALPFEDGAVDWVVSTLLFHHFSPEENVRLLREVSRVARHGVAMLDLRRHLVPLWIVSLAGRLLFRTPISVHDGMASVRQAYTPQEARAIAQQAVAHSVVQPLFPYRLWIRAPGESGR